MASDKGGGKSRRADATTAVTSGRVGDHRLMIANVYRPTRTATKWSCQGSPIRLHIGLEDAGDLKADLETGFAALNAANMAKARVVR